MESHPRSWMRTGLESLVPFQSIPFPSVWGGVLLQGRRVRIADRCRRRVECGRRSSRTSSYPDSWDETQRPFSHSCVTAATGGCAPSNPRVGLRPTICSCEQQPPDRKFSHGSILGSGQGQRKSGVKGCEWRATPRSSRGRPWCNGPFSTATDRWPVDGPGPPRFSSSGKCRRPV